MRLIREAALCLILILGVVTPLLAEPESTPGVELQETFDFNLDSWYELSFTDGPVTLHRVRLDAKEGGQLARTKIIRPMNNEYLKMVKLVLEYTNSSTSARKVHVTVTWFDGEGRMIDGFSSREKLKRQSARKLVEISVPTFEYGLDRAERLELEVDFIH